MIAIKVEAYSERYQTSKMERFAKIINFQKLLTMFGKALHLRYLRPLTK